MDVTELFFFFFCILNFYSAEKLCHDILSINHLGQCFKYVQNTKLKVKCVKKKNINIAGEKNE